MTVKRVAPKRKPAKRSNGAAVGRRIGLWAAKGAGRLALSAATHGASTAGRVSAQAFAATARHSEERRLHGHRAVVRDLTDPHGSPLSLKQVESRLLGLDQQRENALAKKEGREPRRIAWTQSTAPRELVEYAAQPLLLSWAERRQLRRQGWAPSSYGYTHKKITEQLGGPPATPPLEVDPDPSPVRPVAPVGGPIPTPTGRATPGGTMQEPTTHEALADPQIDPANWQEELPVYLRAVADRLVAQWVEAAGAMTEYFRTAQTPGEVQGPIDEFQQSLEQAREQAERMASAAEEYVASLQLPHFEKVS